MRENVLMCKERTTPNLWITINEPDWYYRVGPICPKLCHKLGIWVQLQDIHESLSGQLHDKFPILPFVSTKLKGPFANLESKFTKHKESVKSLTTLQCVKL